MDLYPTQTSLESFYEGGPTTFEEAFPPVCIQSHWDSTQISTHVLPTSLWVPQTLDPRPATRVCTSYYTTSQGDAPLHAQHEDILPMRNDTTVRAVPPGGAAGRGAPYTLYAETVNQESELQRLSQPLSRCKTRRYVPTPAPTDASNLLPNVSQQDDMAKHALYVKDRAGCREADDQDAWNKSSQLFFNHTRTDRNRTVKGPLACK
jgi:hypothetical protein